MTSQAVKNRRNGFAAERRYMMDNWVGAFGGTRFYASLGIFDVIFVDYDGIAHLVQVKSSAMGKPYISPREIQSIQDWIDVYEFKGNPHLWIGYVLMSPRELPVEVRMN